jgi:hypothetical protein
MSGSGQKLEELSSMQLAYRKRAIERHRGFGLI